MPRSCAAAGTTAATCCAAIPDGTLDFVDRRKYLIKSGGENIYPAEIERVLIALPGVADVVVVRKPDPKWGEVPVAFIVPRDDCTLTADQAIAACRGQIARYKIPKEVRFIAETDLRRSASGKIMRGDLEIVLKQEMAAARAGKRGRRYDSAAQRLFRHRGHRRRCPANMSATSRRTMPWFLGRAFAELIRRSGIAKSEIDGLAVSSYQMAPDNGASMTADFRHQPAIPDRLSLRRGLRRHGAEARGARRAGRRRGDRRLPGRGHRAAGLRLQRRLLDLQPRPCLSRTAAAG